uniref:Oxysterol binding protein 3 n=1 Tax=Rhipicephalus appendiculatus TaxID=34631 RepID=A0A131YP84_RHIAP
MEELQPEMAAVATTTTTTASTTNNNSDSDASPGRSSPASQQSEPGSRAAPDAAAARPDVQAAAAGSSRRRRAADWEIMQGLRTGQRCDDKPKKFEGYLLKRRKWPLKGWHKRFFCLEKGILTYAKSSTDMAKGKNHGSVDLGLSVISTKGKGRRIDIDAEEFIYHLKVKNQAQFQQWVSQLQHHRLYRQHEITFGSREAPKMTSPAAEDSGGVPGGNGPSGALTICKCPLTDSTCHRHHCYRELMLSARTCTQACLTGPLLGSQGFNTCKCSKVAAKESAASENLQLNTAVSSDVPSTSTNGRELVALEKEVGEDVRHADKNSLAEATPKESKEGMLAIDTGKRASQMPVDAHDDTEPKIGAEASDGVGAGRGATTCGIDTDTFVVTFYPALGSNHTNSLTCDTSSEEMPPVHALDERTCTGANVVDVSNLQNSERQMRERETPTIRSNSLVTRRSRNFSGLQTLRQGTNVGVNTDSNGETVETEHNTRVKIMGHTHPRMVLKGRKNRSAPTPQVIVGTFSTDKSALTHPERLDQQKALKQHNSSGHCLIDSGCGTQRGLESGPEHLDLHSVSPQGTSSNVKAENLANCELPEPTSRSPDFIMPPSHSGNDPNYIDNRQAVPHLSFRTVCDSDPTAQDLSFSFEPRGLHEPAQSRSWPCSDGSSGRLNKGPCRQQAELGGIDWLLPSVESSDDPIEDVPVRALTDVAHPAVPDGAAGQISGLSHSGIGAESHQSGQSSAQYCTALPEQTGSEFRDTLQTFLFLHSDSSFFVNLQHSPSEIPKLKYGELGSCQTANGSSEHSA